MTNCLIGRACALSGRPPVRYAGRRGGASLHLRSTATTRGQGGWGSYPSSKRTSVRSTRLMTDKNKELRVLFLGLDNAGKTTTLKHFMHEPIDTVSPTLGFSIRTLSRDGYVQPDLITATLSIYVCAWQANHEGDVGGQRSLRPYWRNYFEKTDGIVWVVDSGDPDRMDDCCEELWKLLGEEVRSRLLPSDSLEPVCLY